MKKFLLWIFTIFFLNPTFGYADGARLSNAEAKNALGRHGASVAKGYTASNFTGANNQLQQVNVADYKDGDWRETDSQSGTRLIISYPQAREIIARWVVGDKAGGGSSIKWGDGNALDFMLNEVIVPDEELSDDEVASDTVSNDVKLQKKKHKAHAFFASKAKADKYAKQRPGSKVVPFRRGWRVEKDIYYYVDKTTNSIQGVLVHDDKVEVNEDKPGTLVLKHTPSGAMLKYGDIKERLALLALGELEYIYHIDHDIDGQFGFITQEGLSYLVYEVFANESGRNDVMGRCNPYLSSCDRSWWTGAQKKRWEDLLDRFSNIAQWHYPCRASELSDKKLASGECVTTFKDVQVSDMQARVLAGIWALQKYGTEIRCADWYSGDMVENTKGVNNDVKYREWQANTLNTTDRVLFPDQDFLTCKTIDGAHDLQFEFNDLNETKTKKVVNNFVYGLQHLVGGEVQMCGKTKNKILARKFRLENEYMSPGTMAYSNTKEEAIKTCEALSGNLAPYMPYGSEKLGKTKYFVERGCVYKSSGLPTQNGACSKDLSIELPTNLVCYYASGADDCGEYDEETETVTKRNDLTEYGVDSDAFDTLKIRYTPDTINLIRHHVEYKLGKNGKQVKQFGCSALVQENGFIRCMVQINGDSKEYVVDFAFSGTYLGDSDKRSKADKDGMNCLVAGGQYDGSNCQGFGETECKEFAKQQKVNAEWNDVLGLCMLPNATSATYLEDSARRFVAGAVFFAAVIVAIPTAGASLYTMTGMIMIGTADYGKTLLSIDGENETRSVLANINNSNSNCKAKALTEEDEKQCNYTSLQELNVAYSDVNGIIEDETLIRAISDTAAVYVEGLPEEKVERMREEWGRLSGGKYQVANEVLTTMKTIGVILNATGFFKSIVNILTKPGAAIKSVVDKVKNPKESMKSFVEAVKDKVQKPGEFTEDGRYIAGWKEASALKISNSAFKTTLKDVALTDKDALEISADVTENVVRTGVARANYGFSGSGTLLEDANWISGTLKQQGESGPTALAVGTSVLAGRTNLAGVGDDVANVNKEMTKGAGSVEKATGVILDAPGELVGNSIRALGSLLD